MKRTLGTEGRRIRIETNHLPLNIRKLKQAEHYDVTFIPDRPKRLFRAAINTFREVHYSSRYPAFDGVKNLYSSTPLPFGGQIEGTVNVEGDDGRRHEFKIAIKWVNSIDLTILQTYLSTNEENVLKSLNLQEPLQCIDIVLRHAVSTQFIPVGRSYFSEPREQVLLGEGMGLYHGFYLSSILGWKPYLNVDVAHKAFPIGGEVLNLICSMFNYRAPLDIMDPRNDRDYNTFEKYIRGLKIEYQLPGMYRFIWKVLCIIKAFIFVFT